MSARKVISLYTGAGGLDLGLEAAGFDLAAAVEMEATAVRTLRTNREWNVIDRDIQTVSTAEILESAGLREGDADLLAGGPPCQPFSKSGYWHSGDSLRLHDPRAATLAEYLRVLKDAKPKVFLLENVPGLAFSEKDEGLESVRRTIDSINREVGTRYSFFAAQLNAVQHGVPQTRERVFVVGHRDGADFEFPKPTHRRPVRTNMTNGGLQQELWVEELDPEDGLEAPRTAWDAIGTVHRRGNGGYDPDTDPELQPRGRWAGLLKSIPEGHNYLYFTSRGGGSYNLFGWRRHFWSFLLKLAKNRPAWTLTAQPGPAIGPFHWNSRRLSSAELCALQTVPKGYHVVGDAMDAHRQLGNAVPSALAELLGLQIRRTLLGDLKANPWKLTLIPKKARRAPPPEEPAPVTDERYLALHGFHSAHPGTGMGRGAQARPEAERV
jgi:DNA (cytosine-5)-methyltransferase 1